MLIPFSPRSLLLSLILLAASLASPSTRALAGQQPFAIAVRPATTHSAALSGPGYFLLRLAPGRAHRSYALLTNHGPRALTVDLAPVDALRDARGAITYRLQSAPRTQVGAWVHLLIHTVYIRRGESVVIRLQMTLPRPLHPGTYLGALTVFPTVHRPQHSSHAVIGVQMRLADAIVITVTPPTHRRGAA